MEPQINIGSGIYEMRIDWDYPYYLCILSSGVSKMFGIPIGYFKVYKDGKIEPCERPGAV